MCLVAEIDGAVAGYALVLLRRGTSLARLYSIAVDPDRTGRRLGAALLAAAERAAIDRDALFLRLEVRSDNAAAIALYRRAGYRAFGRYLDYYEDHAEALRFEKSLAPLLPTRDCAVPYYGQSTDFTCGATALMMAMAALDPAIALGPQLEFRLWRESTTVFMTSGHGGCDPYGLALAAHRRGFKARVFVSDDSALFLDGVRSEMKKQVMRLVQEDFRALVAETDIEVQHRPLVLEELTAAIDRGEIPLVLISHYRMYSEKTPHWLVVHGHDARFIYAHDSWIDEAAMDTASAKANMPIPRAEFERMARYGRANLRAAVIIRTP